METRPVRENPSATKATAKAPATDMKPIVETLNRILEMELAGTVLYTHFSFVVCGNDRMQFAKWFEAQAAEALAHAKTAGDLVTQLGYHPSLRIADLTESQQHDTASILRDTLTFEKTTLSHYVALLELVAGTDVMIEEYARQHVYVETQHIGEVEKMLRRPADLKNQEAA